MSGSTSGVASRRQKRMGPAPFASFEDLSDELESPEDKNAAGSVVRLPGIREDATPTPSNTPAPIDQRTPEFTYTGISLVGAAALSPPSSAMSSLSTPQSRLSSLQTPSTPRIDISRASSSSHHDSRDSTPERELFEGHDPATAKLGLGFREEGALDLRSSTEELDFHDAQQEPKKKGQSGLSRSPSPHKMLLETSFCGTKPPESTPATAEQSGTKVESEVLEKVLLSRKHDPTEAVLAEGISVIDKNQPPEKPARKLEKRVQSVKSDITIKVDEPSSAMCVSNNTPNTPNIPRKIIAKSGVEYIYIPLKGPLPVDNDTTTIPTTSKPKAREVKSVTIQSKTSHNNKQIASKQKAKSATPSPTATVHWKEEEPKYIRIRLKPDYMYSKEDDNADPIEMQKPDTLDLSDRISRKPAQHFSEIITIQSEELRAEPPAKIIEPGKSLSNTPGASPKLPRHGFLKDTLGSKTPSPSLSRKSSFASLFRSKEAIMSPESPTIPGCRRKNTISGMLREAGDNLRDRSRSRSKSRDRDKAATLSTAPSSTESIDSKSKQKSVFSIFKPNKKGDKLRSEADGSSNEILPSIEGIAKVEFKFNESNVKGHAKKYYETPLEGDSIRIPLHSPTHYDDNNILQDLKTSSQDSQDTVIEVSSKRVEAVVEAVVTDVESNTMVHSSKTELSKRQSSTSSENVVFSTKLGSNNEIFSTKFPKDKQGKTLVNNEANGPDVVKEEIQITRTKSSLSVSKSERKSIEEETADEAKTIDHSNRNSMVSSAADDDRYSSESERDSELELPTKNKKELKLDLDYVEPERKGLVLQQDSYEDELPYIPTTLPQERSAAVPIVPIKQRSTFEMKTCPIERPRSTTPINPSCLEEYCEEVMGSFNTESVTRTIEKLKISLPRHDSVDKPVKSPRKPNNTNWFEFAEKGISTGRRSSLTQENDTPPPLPPKSLQKEWINFEEIPERRKPPKRIQTLPSRGHIEVPDSVLQDNVVYNYVNPEECKCECHEITREKREKETVQEDELPLLEDEQADEEKGVVDRIKLDVTVSDRRSVVSDSSIDLSTSVEPPEANGGLDLTLRTPFTSDLGVSSNRSSIVSQDEPQSPDPGSPNAFPKTF